MKSKNKAQSSDQEQIKNPHDRFLKRTLEDIKKVEGTLEGILPPSLFKRLKLDSLRKEDTSYIDKKLKQYFSDIVYTCITKDKIPLKIAFLFEHKSYPPEYPHLQLLRYMLEIWDRQAKERQTLSLVLPILIYHGREAWKYSSFPTYFQGDIDEELAVFIPFFDFILANLQAASYAEINQRFNLPSLRIAFRLMKSIRDEDLTDKLQDIFDGLSILEKDAHGRIYFETIIVYLYHVLNTDLETVMENMYHISQEASEFADSIAMRLIRQGREEARKEIEAEVQKRLAESKHKEVEAKKKEAEAKKKEAEAKKKEAEAKKKEAEAKKKEAEAKKKEAEAIRKEAEAIRKEAETKEKAEIEKKNTITKMLKAKMEKELIADFLGLTMEKLETYIQEIEKEKEAQEEDLA